MGESQLTVNRPELYERLIDRLGLALDVARTSAGLRDEMPAELELRGLSPAEFQVIQTYLDGLPERRTSDISAQSPSGKGKGKIVWLRDRRRSVATTEPIGQVCR